jgi:hypothetical protein
LCSTTCIEYDQKCKDGQARTNVHFLFLHQSQLLHYLFCMSRRTAPRAKTDALSFAIAVKIAVPERGLGQNFSEIHRFLNEVIGNENFANHPGQAAGIAQVTVFYFRDLEAAMIFKGRFKDLVLANAPEPQVLANEPPDPYDYRT